MLIFYKTEGGAFVINLNNIEYFFLRTAGHDDSIAFVSPGEGDDDAVRAGYDNRLKTEYVMLKILQAHKNGENVVDISRDVIDKEFSLEQKI